ncbi:hypothetical protein D7W79_17760 [Corallococcus exercitus]|uniref:DUF6068 family protein n=1 Tax=Corallococcus exercitus TaxID=2316736 RepID=UPI000EA01C3A|nr:DUF6068 family protein [Corallococcus exercitus]RKG76440.1 hypothetical protein D7W79_17760 [Corallococcus exercitus]
MQRLSFRQGFIAVAGVALVLLMGCGTSRPRGFISVTEFPPGSSTEETPRSWQDARVGDRVEYVFGAFVSGSSRGGSSVGQLFVEVVAVQAPWVWLSIRITRNDGQPHPHPFLSHDFVLPMRMGQAPPNLPDPIKDGSTSITRLWAFAAGQHWSARQFARDDSMGDGPEQQRLYATTPGPLYLTNGLLKIYFSAVSPSDFAIHSLALASFRRGSSTTRGTPPAMDHPLGPGTWYEVREQTRQGVSEKRVCLGAEQGYLLRRIWTRPPTGKRCEDFQGAAVLSLEDALLNLVNKTLGVPIWPPRYYGAPLPRQGQLQLGQSSVLAYFDETPDVMEHVSLKVTVRAFATDVWNPVLRGLPMEARFNQVSEETFWQPRGGVHQFISSSRLSGWGTWLEPSELSTSTR